MRRPSTGVAFQEGNVADGQPSGRRRVDDGRRTLHPRRGGSDEVGDVEEDVKRALGGRDGVAAVPRLRLRLVGEEGGADKGSVDDLPEGIRRLGGEAAGDPVCNRGGSGEHTVAGLQLLVGVPQPVPHPDAVLGLDDLEHFGAED